MSWLAFQDSRCTAAAPAAKSRQSSPTLCDPIDGSPPSLGFSRQEHWSGLPFPSPIHESESEVAQSCLTPSDPMDCSLPGSSVHGIFQARVLEWGAIAFSEQMYSCHYFLHWLPFKESAVLFFFSQKDKIYYFPVSLTLSMLSTQTEKSLS